MSSSPVLNPEIPYVGEVEGGLFPGKMLKVQGKVIPEAVRFAINFQLGPNLNPRDDIAIHVSPRFPEGFVTRNHIESMSWGREENEGPLWLSPGQEFEIIILCDPACYKIAINGRHFTEFAHRLPYQKVTHLVIDGDVEINTIRYEGDSAGAQQTPRAAVVPDIPTANFGPPGPGGLYPTLGPQEPIGPQGGGYQGPGRYGPASDPYGGSGGYNPPGSYGYQPGYGKPEEEEEQGFGGCLDKVGLALGGLVAAGGVAAAMHAMKKNKEQDEGHEKSNASTTDSEKGGTFGGLDISSLGTALASSLAASALQGDTRPQQAGYPPHDSNSGGGVLGSILGALGGGGGGQQPSYPPPQQSGGSDPLSGALGSIVGGLFGGGGNQQSNYQPGYQPYQPSGGYNHQPSGGYPSNQGSDNSNLLSGIGSALGSSLFNSALDGLSKHGKDKPQGYNNPSQGPVYNYGAQNDSPAPQAAARPTEPPAPGGGKLSAAEISRGLGLSDDED